MYNQDERKCACPGKVPIHPVNRVIMAVRRKTTTHTRWTHLRKEGMICIAKK